MKNMGIKMSLNKNISLEDVYQAQNESFKTNPKILLIEDDIINQKLLLNLSKQYKFTLYVANNGLEGLEQLEKYKIDCIIVDIVMPKLNGLDTLAKIREIEDFSNIPIIVCTAYNNPTILKETLKLGANDFFLKPVDLPKLLSSIKKYTEPEIKNITHYQS